MGLFRKRPSARRRRHARRRAAGRPGAPWSLWADGFGKLGIRAIQIIVVVRVATAIIFAIQSLTLVTIPLVIALILAARSPR